MFDNAPADRSTTHRCWQCLRGTGGGKVEFLHANTRTREHAITACRHRPRGDSATRLSSVRHVCDLAIFRGSRTPRTFHQPTALLRFRHFVPNTCAPNVHVERPRFVRHSGDNTLRRFTFHLRSHQDEQATPPTIEPQQTHPKSSQFHSQRR